MQTNPGQYKGIFDGAITITQREGLSSLLLGTQATIIGYLWYGISVYPSYTFFKNVMASLLPAAYAVAHANDVALVAGAVASIIASLGLTPIEAARIRAVSEPARYKPLGLWGTLGVIAREGVGVGWKNLYAGLPSLMTRQVIFGSVKFLVFERVSEAILLAWPMLRDGTMTSLGVSLVAGGISGALSSVVSQPADSVLTYVTKQSSGNLGVLDGARMMIKKDGVGSLFRGLGSRCVWAGCIIAGQFLLYDVFRALFGITGDDLNQVYEIVLLPSR
jgi:solute carrier family 25 phosphate transporter 3